MATVKLKTGYTVIEVYSQNGCREKGDKQEQVGQWQHKSTPKHTNKNKLVSGNTSPHQNTQTRTSWSVATQVHTKTHKQEQVGQWQHKSTPKTHKQEQVGQWQHKSTPKHTNKNKLVSGNTSPHQNTQTRTSWSVATQVHTKTHKQEQVGQWQHKSTPKTHKQEQVGQWQHKSTPKHINKNKLVSGNTSPHQNTQTRTSWSVATQVHTKTHKQEQVGQWQHKSTPKHINKNKLVSGNTSPHQNTQTRTSWSVATQVHTKTHKQELSIDVMSPFPAPPPPLFFFLKLKSLSLHCKQLISHITRRPLEDENRPIPKNFHPILNSLRFIRC